MLLSLLLAVGVAPVQAATKSIVFPTYGTVSGKYLYYGFNKNLYRYNISTGKRALLMERKCNEITKKGTYLYFTNDEYIGSDGTDLGIYRIGTSGMGKKFLDNGCDPVIIGNYIYYIKMRHEVEEYFEKDFVLGVYRMNLDGSGSTCIYESADVELLASSGNNLFILPSCSSSMCYCYNTKTKKITSANIAGYSRNVTNSSNDGGMYGGGYKFTYFGNSIYRNKAGKKAKILTAEGNFDSMFFSNGYVIAKYQGPYNPSGVGGWKADIYIVKKNGTGKKLVEEWPLAN